MNLKPILIDSISIVIIGIFLGVLAGALFSVLGWFGL